MKRGILFSLIIGFLLASGVLWSFEGMKTNHVQILENMDPTADANFGFSWATYKQGIKSYFTDLANRDLGSFRVVIKGRDTTVDMASFMLERAWRSAKTLLPALAVGIGAGILFGILTFFLPKPLRKILGGWNQLVFSTPDVLWVFLLILLAILIDSWVGEPLVMVAELAEHPVFLLPVLSVSIPIAAYLYFYTVHSISEFLNQDYVTTAKAKGLPASYVFVKYVMRPAADSLLIVIPKMIAIAVSSLVVVELIYNIYGVTWYMASDPKINASLLIALALFVVLVQILTSLLRLWVNPALRK